MKRGFTIVELIIVIVVIGILATLTVMSYRSVQRGAVLSKAMTDLSAINDGIKIYHAKNGKYPSVSGWVTYCDNQAQFTSLLGVYIDKVPAAPCGSSSYGVDSWAYWTWGDDYKLIHNNPVSIQSVKDQIPSELRDPVRFSTDGSWGFWSSGASGW